MKIYNKKNFFIGLFGELLFIALLVFNIRRGEASFLYVCTALMWLAIGGRIIFRSLSLNTPERTCCWSVTSGTATLT